MSATASRNKQRWEDRFWPRVDKTDMCWLWTGGKSAGGYGQLYVDGKVCYTHRLSYELHHGPIPEGMFVLHECDTPACVNPAHLSLGTNRDNVQDMNRKGRGRVPNMRGEDVGTAKLTASQVLDIRERYGAGGITQKRLGQEFGVTQEAVSYIVRGETWAHV